MNNPYVASGSFAEACYDQNSIAELELALQGDADQGDMDEWRITAAEWRQGIALALAARRRALAPYPMCRDPEACAGRGYCPRDPACND
jgi:hypothetical protein